MLEATSTTQQSSVWSQLPVLPGARRWRIAILALASLLVGFCESGILAVLAQVAAALVNGSSRVRTTVGPVTIDEAIGALLAIAGGLAVVRLCVGAVATTLPAEVAADALADVRQGLLDAFTNAAWGLQSADREGELQELMTYQSAQAAVASAQASVMVTSILAFLVMAISAVLLNSIAALVVLATAGGLFLMLRPLAAIGGRRAHALSRTSVVFAGTVSEAARLAEENHVFGVAEAQNRRVTELLGTVRTQYFQTQLLGNLVPGVYQSLIYLVVILGLVGVYLAGAGHVASLGAVVLMLVRAGTYGQQAQTTYQNLRQALPYLERVQQARHRYSLAAVPVGHELLSTVQSVALRNVYFSYQPDTPVLHDLNFEVTAGEAIGIVGPSGAGKSTLVQILLGLRAPTAGEYLINGLPAESFSRRDWQRLVSYVPQEPRLLHASVTDNIRFFRDIDQNQIVRAAKLAGIHDEVIGWSQQYETIVGPRADAVSGGQQQRICLARALAAAPEMLVLDEPTSALDRHSEAIIRISLEELKGRITLFVVAHRPTILEVCERVMVIRDGRLDAAEESPLLALEKDLKCEERPQRA